MNKSLAIIAPCFNEEKNIQNFYKRLTTTISELNLEYKIYFVDRQQIQKYRDFWVKKEEEKFNKKLEKGREDLELKKEQVVNEILNIFLEKSINSFKEQFEKDYISEYSELKEYYDNESDDYEEIFWYDIPLVQFILNKYIEIVKLS